MGLMLAEPGFHTRCHVEWEGYPRDTLTAAMRAGYFPDAPIWDNLKTFDARPLAGAIDTVLAGYPCQPFSQAGQRKGKDDPRHLFPHVARVITELGPAVRWVFLENVEGHFSLGGETVLRTLRSMGFTPATGLFSAAETGAPHGRKRWFCVAYRAGVGTGESDVAQRTESRERAREIVGGRGGRLRGELADANGRDTGAERQQRGGELGFQPEGQGTGAGNVDSPASPRCDNEGIGPGAELEGGECLPGEGCDQLADAVSGAGHEGRAGDSGSRDRARGTRQAIEPVRSVPYLFPPGPADRTAWEFVTASAAHRIPAYSRRDLVGAALRLAALVPPDAAQAIEQRARDMAPAGILDAMESEARKVLDDSETVAAFRRMADGLASRPRALRLLGNGVCPLAAGYAWRTLSAAHGLRPLDMGTASRDAATNTTQPAVKEPSDA